MPYSVHLIFIVIFSLAIQHFIGAVPHKFEFTTENGWLTMPDGVRLSVTLTIPEAESHNEKFPVLLEYRPYRKDDNFFNSDLASIFYLARRGFIVRRSLL
jgi:predicted acyl esterase